MWNISTYQWLQGIRYYTESYHDLTEIFSLTYLPIIAELEPFKVMKVKSMENFKFNCDSYTNCLVPQKEEEHKNSTDKIVNSAYFAKLLIQELVTQRRLSATMKEEEIELLDTSSTSNEVLDHRWTTEEEDNAENITVNQEIVNNWTLEENDLYNLDTCLQIVDDSFEDILDDVLSSCSEELSTEIDGTHSAVILDCDDEQITFENKEIPQSAIYQNIFELRKEHLIKNSTKNKRQCIKVPEVLYENIWDFASTNKCLEIKHGNFCRVSTMFDETCQELVVPEVLPLKCDLDYIIPECVNQWMKILRYDYCSEDDEVLLYGKPILKTTSVV